MHWSRPGRKATGATRAATGASCGLRSWSASKGERPARLRALAAEAEAADRALDGELDGWRLVNLVFLRSAAAPRRAVQMDGGQIEYRARLLKT